MRALPSGCKICCALMALYMSCHSDIKKAYSHERLPHTFSSISISISQARLKTTETELGFCPVLLSELLPTPEAEPIGTDVVLPLIVEGSGPSPCVEAG
jgi:hypothetical protein